MYDAMFATGLRLPLTACTKYNTCSTSLSVGQTIHVYTPLRILFCPLVIHVNELYDEISDHLPLNGSTRAILYV